MFKLEFKTDNAAFQGGDRAFEVARILRDIANRIENEGVTEGRAMDYNGNGVGTFELTED